jgi:hypothetical protein
VTDGECGCDESLRLRKRVHIIVDAWERYSRNDLSREEFEGTMAEMAQAEETSVEEKQPEEPYADIGIWNCANYCGVGVRKKGRLCSDCMRMKDEKQPDPQPLFAMPTQAIVLARSALTYLRTKLRDVDRLDEPARQALDWIEVALGAESGGPAVAAKPEPPASELSDGALEEIFLGFASIRLGYRALYDAGRAKAENELVRLATGLIEAFEAECEPEADADDGDLPPHKAVDCAFRLLDEKTARIAKLEAERAAHAATKAEFDEVIRGLYARLREVHADARKARPMPTREAIGEALKKHSALASGVKSSPWLSYADAVLALFGAQEEQDSAPGEPGNTQKLGCYDCGRDYTLGPDLVVSNEDWARIAPNPPDGGVLCPNCMHDRFVKILGNRHTAGGIRAEFMSGPFAKLAPAQPSLEGVLEESASDSRLQAEARKLGIREHEWRCPCDVCSRTSQLCPASRAGLSGLVEDVKARLAAQSLEGMPREWRERLSDLESRVAKLERGH